MKRTSALARRPLAVLLLCLGSLLSLPHILLAQGSQAEDAEGPPLQFAGELELEKTVAERLEQILTPLVGEVIVLVDLSLKSLPVALEGFTYSQQESLPGLPVSVSENVRKLGGSSWDYNEIGGISIRVFVPVGSPDSALDRITEMIPLWINLNYARGDQIIVEQVPLIRPPRSAVDLLFTWQGIGIAAGLTFLILLLVAVLARSLTGGKVRVQGSVHGSGGSAAAISGPISPASMAQMMHSLGDEEQNKKKKSSEEEGPTGTVTSHTLSLPEGALSVRLVRDGQNSARALGSLARIASAEAQELALLLRQVEPATAALALNLARPVAAANYLAEQSSEQRRALLDAWRSLDAMSSEEASRRADDLRGHLDSMRTASLTASGADPLAKLINQASEEAGRRIYDDLAGMDPALASEVRSQVFFLDDLLSIEPRRMKRALMSLPREVIAALLIDATSELREAVYSSLSNRAANLLRDEMSTMRQVSPERAAEAKRLLRSALDQIGEASA